MIDFNRLSEYDAQIKAYIGLQTGKTNGVTFVIGSVTPTSSTLTYTIEGTKYNFKVGDEIIVPDNQNGTEGSNYKVVYKLYDIVDDKAYWGLSGSASGLDKVMETVNVTLSAGSFTSELIGAKITTTIDGDVTEATWNGSYSFQVPFGTSYSVAVGSVTGFDTPNSQSVNKAIAGNTRNMTFEYGYKSVEVTVGTNQSNLADLNGTKVTIAGKEFTIDVNESLTQTFTIHVTTGTSVAFTFNDVTGYKTPSIKTATANNDLSYTVNYQTTVVSVNAIVGEGGSKTANDVKFTVNGTEVANNGTIKVPTESTIAISSTDLTEFGYGCTINPVSGSTATGASMTFTATYAYGSVFTANIVSNQTNDTSLTNETITLSYDSVSETLSNGDTLVIPPGKSVTCVFSNVNTDYKKPTNLTFTTVAGTNYNSSEKIYQTEVLSVTSVTTDSGSVSGQSITVNGVAKSWSGSILTWKIPFGASDVVTTTKSGFGVTITKNPSTDIADSVSKTVTIAFAQIKDGVYAITSSGTEVAYANINTSNTSQYVGVVVRDSSNKINFFIDKRFPTSSSASATVGNYKAWATNNYSVDITGITNISGSSGSGSGNYWSSSQISQARTLHKNGETGIANTDKIVAQYTSDTAANNAAKYCRSIANPISGKYDGYLGSAAEWIAVHENLNDINNTLEKIGGVKFSYNMSGYSTDTYCWTSTEYGSNDSWYWYWYSGYSHPYFYYDSKSYANQYYCARIFYPIG